jgi:hypothetical protein
MCQVISQIYIPNNSFLRIHRLGESIGDDVTGLRVGINVVENAVGNGMGFFERIIIPGIW